MKQPKNYGKPWDDEDLVLVLLDAPTHANAVKNAARFERKLGSLEMIYRWAMTPKMIIKKRGRKGDKFIEQIRRVAMQLGWLT